jgi:hypothetical protein
MQGSGFASKGCNELVKCHCSSFAGWCNNKVVSAKQSGDFLKSGGGASFFAKLALSFGPTTLPPCHAAAFGHSVEESDETVMREPPDVCRAPKRPD